MRRVANSVDVSELSTLYKTMGLKAIAKRVGIGHGSVRRLLVEAGVDIRPGRTPSIAIDKDKLVELYSMRKLSTTDIAKELGINKSTVLDKLLDYGIPIRSIKGGERLAILDPNKKHGKPRFERVKSIDGYWLVISHGHARARFGGYVLEHILIWEAAYSALPIGWVIHHLNGNRLDNRVCNLWAFRNNSEHISFHAHARRSSGVSKKCLAEWLESHGR